MPFQESPQKGLAEVLVSNHVLDVHTKGSLNIRAPQGHNHMLRLHISSSGLHSALTREYRQLTVSENLAPLPYEIHVDELDIIPPVNAGLNVVGGRQEIGDAAGGVGGALCKVLPRGSATSAAPVQLHGHARRRLSQARVKHVSGYRRPRRRPVACCTAHRPPRQQEDLV